ncbi:hypothetical protein [Methanobacterium sp. SMA-27]|uniref:hypothetical protein n=1 Tax=Methanobacterium sp. SMA-27 TaxID=1495336 RepID=UPI000693B988|nr:hypothetical protein [Methanobacterium sp. SMA-27]
MRYSYGIMDRRKILLYEPQIFLSGDDILVFPTRDFHKWQGDIKEYIDGLYQINSTNMKKTKSFNIAEFNLAVGVLNNITEELEHLFDPNRVTDYSYHYISTLDEKYKKQIGNSYTSDMRRCDIKILVKPKITPRLKYHNMMEIVNQVAIDFADASGQKSKKTVTPQSFRML